MMNSQKASEYRLMVGFAVVHCLTLFAFAFPIPWPMQRLWAGWMTLCFLWLIVLVLHPGRSMWRLAISLPLVVILMLPSLSVYNFLGPVVFGWPEGMSMHPIEDVRWVRAYVVGRAEAKDDIRRDHLVIEEYGFGAGAGHRREIFRDRFGIDLNATAGCIVDSRILGHAAGYNSISLPEIARRFGRDTVESVDAEGAKFDREARLREEQEAKDRAQAISSIPSSSNVKLASLQLWVYENEHERKPAPADMAKLTELVHWVESLVLNAVPYDTTAFDTHISGTLSSEAPPKLEISSHATPRPVHMQIYEQLKAPPDVRSPGDRISVAMEFGIARKSEASND